MRTNWSWKRSNDFSNTLRNNSKIPYGSHWLQWFLELRLLQKPEMLVTSRKREVKASMLRSLRSDFTQENIDFILTSFKARFSSLASAPVEPCALSSLILVLFNRNNNRHWRNISLKICCPSSLWTVWRKYWPDCFFCADSCSVVHVITSLLSLYSQQKKVGLIYRNLAKFMINW